MYPGAGKLPDPSSTAGRRARAAVADGRRTAGLARAGADDLAARRTAQPGPAADIRPVPGRLRRPRAAHRGARRADAGLRARRGPAVGAEPGVPPPGPHAAPRPGGPGG